MPALSAAPSPPQRTADIAGRPAATASVHWLMAVLSGVFVLGFFLDAYAHHNDTPESFFTPWHGLLYAGFLATAGYTAWLWWRGRRAGYPWRRALPLGYGATALGALAFLAGGVGDMAWHLAFGIEADVEALFSPTHLLLGLGGVMMAAGPLRAAWLRPGDLAHASWRRYWPVVLSLAWVFSALTFFVQYAHPLTEPQAQRNVDYATQAVGTLGILVTAALTTGVVLLVVVRWTLPPGMLSTILTFNALVMAGLEDRWNLVGAAVAGAVGVELLYRALRPSRERVTALRAFAFGLPLVVYLAYHVGLMVNERLVWSVHLWTGSAVMAGFVGLLLSFLVTGFVVPDDA